MTDMKKVEDMMSTIEKAQHAAMTEAMAHIILAKIVYKTGRASLDLQHDYLKAHVTLFRNEIMAISFCAISTILLETDLSPKAKSMIALLVDEAHSQTKDSIDKFKNLFEHLREDHQQELQNEFVRTECPKP